MVLYGLSSLGKERPGTILFLNRELGLADPQASWIIIMHYIYLKYVRPR